MATLASLGEATLRLSPPDDERLTEADGFDCYVAGASCGVAVAAARLGLDACWLSKLPDTPLAERVTGELARHGVDPTTVDAVAGRVGTDFVERGPVPRGTTAVHDRGETAAATLSPDELATDHVESADAFYLNAETVVRSDPLAETARAAVDVAREADTTVVLDVDSRDELWETADAKQTLASFLEDADLLVVAQATAETVFDHAGDPTNVIHQLVSEYDLETGVLTRETLGPVGIGHGVRAEQEAFDAESEYPEGAEAAFVGGLLSCLLTGDDLATALECGAAAAALTRTIPGNLPVVSRADLRAVRDGET